MRCTTAAVIRLALAIVSEEFRAKVQAPRSFMERQVFEIPSLGGGKGGQFFICDTKRNSDAIFAYYDAFKALAGPYVYQSPSGTVVVQLNNELKPDEATKYEQAISSLP